MRFVLQVFNEAAYFLQKLLLSSIIDSSRNKTASIHKPPTCTSTRSVGSERWLKHSRQPDQWALNVDSEKYVDPTSELWTSTQTFHQPNQWALNVDSEKYVNLTSGLWTLTRKNTLTPRGWNVLSTPCGSEQYLSQPYVALN